MLWASPTRAPATCRLPASPLNCHTSSATCAIPVAPRGCPLEIRPPDGFTTQRPPYVVAPDSTSSPDAPASHIPSASYVSSSLMEKQSCSSTTSTSSMPSPDRSYTWRAASRDIGCPTTSTHEPDAKDSSVSVVMTWATISTARSAGPCRSTNRSDTTTAAAAPSEVGEHWSFVSGRCTTGAARISSTVYTSWNWAYGLFAECRWFLAPTAASCASVVPYFSMCSRAASPKICAVGGDISKPCRAAMIP